MPPLTERMDSRLLEHVVYKLFPTRPDNIRPYDVQRAKDLEVWSEEMVQVHCKIRGPSKAPSPDGVYSRVWALAFVSSAAA